MYLVGTILSNFLSYRLQDLLEHSEDSVFSIHYAKNWTNFIVYPITDRYQPKSYLAVGKI